MRTSPFLALTLINLFTWILINTHPYTPQQEKVIICGTGKNIANTLPKMKQKIEQLGSYFSDYRVIIYENNSTDTTLSYLKKWSQGNNRVIIFSENLSAEQLYNRTKAHALRDKAPNRMEFIAYGREKTLQKALSNEFHDFTFIIQTDLDFHKGWSIDGVLSSFYLPIEWDAIAANSIIGGKNYYDRYAYRDIQFPLGPELLGEEFWRDLAKHPIRFKKTDEPHKVISAFGGIAIYKRNAIIGCHYDGVITEGFRTFMFDIINNQIDNENHQYKKYKEIIGNKNKPLPIIFQPNSGYDTPVVCEHSILHANMSHKGYNKIYINPAMTCYY